MTCKLNKGFKNYFPEESRLSRNKLISQKNKHSILILDILPNLIYEQTVNLVGYEKYSFPQYYLSIICGNVTFDQEQT